MVGKPEGRDNSLKRMPDKEKSNGGSKDCLKSTSFWPKVGCRLNKLSLKKGQFQDYFEGKRSPREDCFLWHLSSQQDWRRFYSMKLMLPFKINCQSFLLLEYKSHFMNPAVEKWVLFKMHKTSFHWSACHLQHPLVEPCLVPFCLLPIGCPSLLHSPLKVP